MKPIVLLFLTALLFSEDLDPTFPTAVDDLEKLVVKKSASWATNWGRETNFYPRTVARNGDSVVNEVSIYNGGAYLNKERLPKGLRSNIGKDHVKDKKWFIINVFMPYENTVSSFDLAQPSPGDVIYKQMLKLKNGPRVIVTVACHSSLQKASLRLLEELFDEIKE